MKKFTVFHKWNGKIYIVVKITTRKYIFSKKEDHLDCSKDNFFVLTKENEMYQKALQKAFSSIRKMDTRIEKLNQEILKMQKQRDDLEYLALNKENVLYDNLLNKFCNLCGCTLKKCSCLENKAS